MRKAEVTILTILYFIITTLAGAYIEKEYNVTVQIEKIVEIEELKMDNQDR